MFERVHGFTGLSAPLLPQVDTLQKYPLQKHCPGGDLFGGRGRIRTHDLLIRSQSLYPTELRAQAQRLL